MSQHLKLDGWLHGFLIDAALYKGRFDDALNKMGNLSALDTGINGTLRRHLRLSSIYYCQGLYAVSSAYVIMHHICMPPLCDLDTHFSVVVVLLWWLNNEEIESLCSMFHSFKKRKTRVILLNYSLIVGACGLSVCIYMCM